MTTQPFYACCSKPCLHNNYFVQFHEDRRLNATDSQGFRVWTNQHVAKMRMMTPFIPNCPVTPETFKKAVDNEHIKCIFTLKRFSNLLEVINTRALLNFSQASKCCYVLMKSNDLWQKRIESLFPNVECMPEITCGFSPEEQFQVAFKRLQDRQRPYICQYNHNLGKDGLSIQAFDHIRQQERCIKALDFIHGELNDQEAFEEMIEASRIAKYNASIPQKAPIPKFGFDSVKEAPSGYIGPNDDCYFSTIKTLFIDRRTPLSSKEIRGALNEFELIESTQFKMMAFTLVLLSNQSTDKIAALFYKPLPKDLKMQFKYHLFVVNGISSAYNGHDYGTASAFGDYMVEHQIRSQVAKKAAHKVCMHLTRMG